MSSIHTPDANIILMAIKYRVETFVIFKFDKIVCDGASCSVLLCIICYSFCCTHVTHRGKNDITAAYMS